MVTRLSDTVWWCDFQGVNAYLLRDEDGLTLVDAGMTWHARALTQAAATVGDGVGSIERVVLTHYDIDHVGALSTLDALDATVYAGLPDVDYLTRDDRPPWNRKGTLQRALDLLRSTPDLDVATLEDGDTVGCLTVHATPGHSPGHMVYVSDTHDVGFLGDLVRVVDGQFDHVPTVFHYDPVQAEQSLRRFVETVPAFEIACPGHGTPFVEKGSDRLREFVDSLA